MRVNFSIVFMHSKGSVLSLMIVALIALALMAFVSINSVTGDFSAPRPPRPSAGPSSVPGPHGGPIIRPPVIVDRGPNTVVVDDDYDDEYVVYGTSSLSVHDCTIAREIKSLKDKLQVPMGDDLVNLVDKCNAQNIY